MVGGQQHACAAPDGGIAIGAQLQALAAHAAPEIVLRVDEMAQMELGGLHGGGQLHAQLPVAVVEDQLAETWAAQFLGLETRKRGGIAMALGVGGSAMPGRGMAAAQACCQIVLGAGRRIVGLGEKAGAVAVAGTLGGGSTARSRRHAPAPRPLKTAPMTTGWSGSPSVNLTSTSWPMRGSHCQPMPWPAWRWATRTQRVQRLSGRGGGVPWDAGDSPCQ